MDNKLNFIHKKNIDFIIEIIYNDVVVLNGVAAVPCNLQSAIAGLKPNRGIMM